MLRQMSDADLLSLCTELHAEMENRGLSVVSTPAQSSKSDEPTVWIPRSGSKYHSKSTCSGMKGPTQVTLSQAKRQGYTPCKKCNPPK